MPEVWLPWLSTGLVAALIVRWNQLASQAEPRRYLDAIGAALLVLTWHPNVWSRFSQGYPGDSIFTLSLSGRAGLIAFTGLLILLLASLSHLKSRWLHRLPHSWPGGRVTMPAIDLMLTILLLGMALTIVPQLHYSYYHLLFEDLPRQWVIKPLSAESIWHSLRMPRDATMALHATGFCAWWLLVLVVLNWFRALGLAGSIWVTGMVIAANLAWHSVA